MTESNYEKALSTALARAFGDLQGKDLKETAFKCGATLEGEIRLKTTFLNRTVEVRPYDNQVLIDAGEADKRTAILILHYLLKAGGVPLSGQMVGFKDVPQGSLYFTPFRNRVLFSMLGILNQPPEHLEKAVQALGGEMVQGGDISFRFRVLPYVPAQYIYYKGEEGIPPDLSILFDASIPQYLDTEDIVVMCEEINRNLKARLAKAPVQPIRDKE
jgi:hypothetical protein